MASVLNIYSSMVSKSPTSLFAPFLLVISMIAVPFCAHAQPGPIKDREIVVLADGAHGNPAVHSRVIQVLKERKEIDPKFNCYFSEFSAATQAEVNKFNSNRSTYQETIGRLFTASGFPINLLPERLLKQHVIFTIQLSLQMSIGRLGSERVSRSPCLQSRDILRII